MNADEIVKELRRLHEDYIRYECAIHGGAGTALKNCYSYSDGHHEFAEWIIDGFTGLLDLIESLLSQLAERDKEIERLREAQRWRNAETEPPKCEDGAETGPILYRMKTTGTIEVGYYGRKGRWRDSYFRHMRSASDGVDADDVSDWMPLPAAPEEVEHE